MAQFTVAPLMVLVYVLRKERIFKSLLHVMNESNKTTQTFKWVVYVYEHALANIEKERAGR